MELKSPEGSKKVQKENKDYPLAALDTENLIDEYNSQLKTVLQKYPNLYNGTLG